MKNNRLESCSTMTLCSALGAIAAATIGSVVTSKEPQQRSRLGLVAFNCSIRRKWMQQQDPTFDLFEAFAFLKHCLSVGAGGTQVSLGVLDAARVKALRDFTDEHKIFIDGIVNPPKDKADLARFESEIRTASEVGVQAVRTVVMPGRRYEQFKSLVDDEANRLLVSSTPQRLRIAARMIWTRPNAIDLQLENL